MSWCWKINGLTAEKDICNQKFLMFSVRFITLFLFSDKVMVFCIVFLYNFDYDVKEWLKICYMLIYEANLPKAYQSVFHSYTIKPAYNGHLTLIAKHLWGPWWPQRARAQPCEGPLWLLWARGPLLTGKLRQERCDHCMQVIVLQEFILKEWRGGVLLGWLLLESWPLERVCLMHVRPCLLLLFPA